MEAAKRPRADDLLVLLAVARTGRYTSAAAHLGLDHTTVARRIAALEDALGGRVVAQSASGWELTDLGRTLIGPLHTIGEWATTHRQQVEDARDSFDRAVAEVAQPRLIGAAGGK